MTLNRATEIARERSLGIRRPLTQTEHEEVNARYPGLTEEHCVECDAATGRAGAADDSLFTEDGHGPLCETCWEGLPERTP
jgi:hypothetical protein